MAASPTPNRSSTQETYERLRADLLSCRLRPGARISINELCMTYGVSLGAVREALSRLTSSEGLIIAEPQRGFRVAPVSAVELQQLSDAMIEIEAICLRRAFATGDIAWEARVLAAHHELTRMPFSNGAVGVGDAREIPRCRFQDELVSTCDNPHLLRMRAMLFDQSARYRALALHRRNEKDFESDYHALLDSVLAREVEKAVDVIGAHRRRTTSILMEALSNVSEDEREALYKRRALPETLGAGDRQRRPRAVG